MTPGLTAFAAIVILPLLLYLPGLCLSRAFLQRHDALEWHFERVLVGALLNGWLALLLAALGIFALWLHILLLLLACGGLLWLARGQPAPAPLHLTRGQHWELAGFALVGLLALLLVARPFEVVLGVRDAAVYANTGFAIAQTGSLVQHDALLAELGQQAQAADPAVRGPAEQALSNFLGVQNPERFIATRLYTAGFMINDGELTQGRIVPQHLHMFSAWIGLLTSLLGKTGGLFAPGLLALLGAWSVGMLGRRLAGGWVGGLAFLLLALNSVQVWFARYPTAETNAQFLIFAGLYCFARWQQDAQPAQSSRANLAYAALAGVAFGQLALTRIDAFLVLAPVMGYLLYCAVTRRWHGPQTALALALGALLLHAGLHIIFIARAYFFDTAFARLQDFAITSYVAQPFITPLLREVYHTTSRSPFKDPWQIWRELALIAAGLAVLLALWRWQGPLRLFESWLLRGRRWLLGAAALLLLLAAGYGYLVRPQILTPTLLAQAPACLLPQHWQGGLANAAPTAGSTSSPAAADPCLTLQGYVGAPVAIPEPPADVDAKRMIPLANLVRVGWYLSPLGIVLGVVGFALWWWRGFSRAAWLFLLVGFLGTFFFVRDTYGTSDQSYIYILRRFVPIAYPTFSLGMAYALVALAVWRPLPSAPRLLRRAPLLASGGLTLLLVAFFAWTGRPIYQHVEYRGALAGLEELADAFAPDDVLLLRGGAPTYSQARDMPDLIATPLRFSFGRNALTVKSSNPAQYADPLAAQVRRWQADGRAVYVLLSASGGSFTLPGFRLQPVEHFRLDLPEYEQLTDQKPRNVATLRLSFAVYRLEPGSPGQLATLPPPLTASDFAAQVRGFYLPEAAPPDERLPRYAWTNGDALLRLPWHTGSEPRELLLHAASGERPAHMDAPEVCLALLPETQLSPADIEVAANGPFIPLGCFTLEADMRSYRVALDPARLPASPTGSALLHLASESWVPAEEDSRRHDERVLGIQFGLLH